MMAGKLILRFTFSFPTADLYMPDINHKYTEFNAADLYVLVN